MLTTLFASIVLLLTAAGPLLVALALDARTSPEPVLEQTDLT